ncbi:MAG: hypothetical protein A2Y10_03110 [Planctomycetes bacterium GWF2_41_51]|nr:MAG: hypothetical protein A2Y10_03110 [Planctomycetes bacterium GWF2_41_51]HBG26054.1 hypothetical protein [Phycisphaerales bacterium]
MKKLIPSKKQIDSEALQAINKDFLSPEERKEVELHDIDKKEGIFPGADLQGKLSTIYAGFKKVSKGYSFSFSNYPFYRIVYTLSGQAKIKDNKQEYIADAGSVYHFSPKETGVILNDSDTPWTHIYIHFTGRDAAGIFKKISTLTERVLHISNPGEIQWLFENILDNCLEKQENSQEICDSLLRALLLKISSHIFLSRRHTNPSLMSYIQCCNYINENFSDLVSLEDVAKKCHISRVYLCRLFNKHAKSSPMSYVMKLKMNKAALLLMQTDYSIKQISLMLNFESQYYFSRIFKKTYGMPPKLYRDRH